MKSTEISVLFPLLRDRGLGETSGEALCVAFDESEGSSLSGRDPLNDVLWIRGF
jgi:hypothetical protein